MKLLKKFKHLISLACVIALAAICVVAFSSPIAVGIGIVSCWQLSQFALAKRTPRCFTSGLTEAQLREFDSVLKGLDELRGFIPHLRDLNEIEGGFDAIKELPDLFKDGNSRLESLETAVKKIRKSGLGGAQNGVYKNLNGELNVSEDCAKHLGSMFVIKAIQDGKLKGAIADNLLAKASEFLGVEMRAAIATSDVPLPVAYGKQIAELVYMYGTARRVCTVYPLSGNSMKLPRLKTGEPQFAFIAISGNVPEKVPQSEWVTFTPGKAGGIVRIPSEIEEDSIFDIGQFVARYIAREMAYWEDYCLFLGDGTSTYNSINGVGAQSTADSTVLQLTSTNTSSDKITITNVRTLRTKPTGAILRTGKYYAHPTMEALFVTFNTSATVTPYIRNADGTASFDGFPIVWVPIMPVYSTSATINAYQIHFGDLSWWYFGLRRDMDVQTSRDVYFATDEIGIRALERFDIHLMGQKATGSLQLAAS